ncbi:MAG TPA: RNA polymerase sigma factor [Candidatus Dormibacteraeota bacterium]
MSVPSKPPFEELYRDFVNRIYAYVRAQVGNAADAEDVTAQVFIKAYEAYPRYEPVGATPASWLFRIARNAALDHLRGSGRKQRLAAAVAHEPEAVEDPSVMALERLEHAALLELVALLPDRQRQVISLRHSGLSFAEVGELMEASEDACKMLYHRTLRALREQAASKGLL